MARVKLKCIIGISKVKKQLSEKTSIADETKNRDKLFKKF